MLNSFKIRILILSTFLWIIFDQFTLSSTKSRSSISENEQIQIDQLRKHLKSKFTQPIMNENGYIVRFLRAADHNMKEAEAMLLRNIAWRKENNMDSILSEDFTNLLKLISFGLSMRTHDGLVVANNGLGQLNLRKFVLAGKSHVIERFLSYTYERVLYEIREASETNGHEVFEGYFLMNMAGYNPRTHGCLACIPALANMIQIHERYYPRTFKEMWAVNTPRIFQSIFNILKPMLGSYTLNTIKFFDYDKGTWQRKLLKYIPKDVLTTEFGGYAKLEEAKSIHNQSIKKMIYYKDTKLYNYTKTNT